MQMNSLQNQLPFWFTRLFRECLLHNQNERRGAIVCSSVLVSHPSSACTIFFIVAQMSFHFVLHRCLTTVFVDQNCTGDWCEFVRASCTSSIVPTQGGSISYQQATVVWLAPISMKGRYEPQTAELQGRLAKCAVIVKDVQGALWLLITTSLVILAPVHINTWR